MHDYLRLVFGTMHYKITPFCEDIYIGNWKQNEFDGRVTYLSSNWASFIGYWVNGDMSGKRHFITSGRKIIQVRFQNSALNGYGTY